MGDYHRRKAEEAALAKWGERPCFDDWDQRDKMRPMPIGAAPKPLTALETELATALEASRDSLRLLQPALNVMAGACLGDIVADLIEPAIAKARGHNS